MGGDLESKAWQFSKLSLRHMWQRRGHSKADVSVPFSYNEFNKHLRVCCRVHYMMIFVSDSPMESSP